MPPPATRPAFARQHGREVRGFSLPRTSRQFEGRFGRIFRTLTPAEFGGSEAENNSNLKKLAEHMVARFDAVKDGEDGEESDIPAAYTYLGQFLDHDLTFDPASSLERQNDPEGLHDFRTPRFDLDSVYGRGPDDQPYLYDETGDFILGENLAGGNPGARDLPRAANGRAVVGDPRNDENVIVSQLQGLFLRFHNAVNRTLDAMPAGMPRFNEAQRLVRWHYQWMILNDFLPRIIDGKVLESVLPHRASKRTICEDPPRLVYYEPRDFAFMPLEFSVAAYRFGHSMVRPGYRLNQHDCTLLSIMPGSQSDKAKKAGCAPDSLLGFRPMNPEWGIDWRRYIEGDLGLDPLDPADPVTDRVQMSYKIDTSLVDPLGNLPTNVQNGIVHKGERPMPSLAERNLVRSWRMRLPSGQAIARAMGIVPLADGEIIIRKPNDLNQSGEDLVPIATISQVFEDNCPLWTYILAEAQHNARKDPEMHALTPKLGPVGGRIVAETFVGIMMQDSFSYLSLHPLWKPTFGTDGDFKLADMIRSALAWNKPKA